MQNLALYSKNFINNLHVYPHINVKQIDINKKIQNKPKINLIENVFNKRITGLKEVNKGKQILNNRPILNFSKECYKEKGNLK